MKDRRALVLLVSCALLGAVLYFFSREFIRNLEAISIYELRILPRYLLPAGAAIALTYLIGTYGWFLTLNALTSGRKTPFLDCMAVLNTGNLAKYVPGKVWSYAFQMYWLSDAGTSRTLILYVNLVNQVIALLSSTMLGLAYLALSPAAFPQAVITACLALLLLSSALFVHYHAALLRTLVSLVKRIFGLEIAYVEVPRRLLGNLFAVYLLAALCFGAAAYLVCLGIGTTPDRAQVLAVMSSMLISDVIGFVVLLAPGGIGIKEGVMYLLLKWVASPALSIILPIATRIVSMLVDVVLGVTGAILVHRRRMKNITGDTAS